MNFPSHRCAAVVAVFLLLIVPDSVRCAERNSDAKVDSIKSKERPEKIDARYTPENLRHAFAALCKTLRYRALRVEVDQSEVPFVLYGVLEGRCDYRAMRDELSSMPDYAYAGCFTGSRGDGAVTVFALNMIPTRTRNGAAQQRLMERLRELANSQW